MPLAAQAPNWNLILVMANTRRLSRIELLVIEGWSA
jgi:predicted nucleic acid-binding protein